MALQPNILDIIKSKIDPVREQGTKMYSQFREAARKNDSTVANILRDFHAFVSSSRKQDSDTNDQVNQLDVKISGISKKSDDLYTQLSELFKQQQDTGFKLRKLIKIFDIDTDNEKIGKGFLNHLKSLFGDNKFGASNLVAAGLGGIASLVVGNQVKNAMSGGGGEAGGQASQSGDQIEQIMATIRQRESNGDYKAKNPNSSASGAYQFIDGTWASLTKKYNIGTEYKKASDAPKEVQDQVARKYVEQILKENNNDVSKVPLVWFTGNAQGKMSEEALKANKGQTGEAYQSRWMESFNKMGTPQPVPQISGTQQGAGASGAETQSVPSFGASTPGATPQTNVTPSVNLTSISSKSGKSAQVDSKSAPQLQGFITDLENTGYKIESLGGYANRQNVNDPSKKSFHAYGMAIDINAANNPNRGTKTDLPPETNELAKKWGLGWGMNWSTVKDPMHFSTAKDEGGNVGQTATVTPASSPTNTSASGTSSSSPQSQTQPQKITEDELITRIQANRMTGASADVLTSNTQNENRIPRMAPIPASIGGSNLITNFMSNIMPGNMPRDFRPQQIENAAISNQIEQPNRNALVRNVDQQPNLNPNEQNSNASVNERQNGMDSRLSNFLQVNNTNWSASLASYYGLQQESGMAYNAVG